MTATRGRPRARLALLSFPLVDCFMHQKDFFFKPTKANKPGAKFKLLLPTFVFPPHQHLRIKGDISGLDFVTFDWRILAQRCAEVLKPRRACLKTSLHIYLLTFGHFTILRVSDDRVPSRPVQAHVVLWRQIKLRAKYLDRMKFNDILMLRI